MAQSSPQPQSVDKINYERENPLPSPSTSSSSSGELHLLIEINKSSPLMPVGPLSSSQELLDQDQPLSQSPPIFATTTHTSISTSQPPPQSRKRPRTTAHDIYRVRSSPIQGSQSPARHNASPPRRARHLIL